MVPRRARATFNVPPQSALKVAMIGRIGTLVHQVLSVVVCSPKVASSGIFPPRSVRPLLDCSLGMADGLTKGASDAY